MHRSRSRFDAPTKAPWPVWAGSVANPVRFIPMARKAAARLWHRARDFDRGTHQPGRHGGALGHTGLAVLHALVFDFLNFRTGQRCRAGSRSTEAVMWARAGCPATPWRRVDLFKDHAGAGFL